MSSIEQMIQDKAFQLGFENCGIIPLEKLSEYGQKMQERVQKVPQSEVFYQRQKHLTEPQKLYPWAQSVIIVAERFNKYAVPDEVKDHIGKHYLFDTRTDENTEEFQAGLELENYLHTLGIKFLNERKFGLVGLRWAAMKAGLGIIRRNNFFYTKSGSWVALQGWLIDKKLELIGTSDLSPCSDKCNRCIKACPSGSLSGPYTMSPTQCVSYLTTLGGRDLANEPLSKTFGHCIYGCDICQDVCPMNRGKWEGTEDFPGITELAPYLTPENIMKMEDTFYKQKIHPKFFYLKPEELWKWKVNVLCFMRNNYKEHYKPYILEACQDKNEKIREVGQSIYNELYGKGSVADQCGA